MQTLDELLQLAAEGDEEAAEEIKRRFSTKEQEAKVAARDLKLKTDTGLKDRYPRALRAYEIGKLKLTADMDEAAMLEALRDKEEELAELGVPLETQTTPQTSTAAGDDDVATDDAPSGAKALSGGHSASSPGGHPHDYVAEAVQAYKQGTTQHDMAKAHAAVAMLNKNPATRSKVQEITRQLEANPILPTGI